MNPIKKLYLSESFACIFLHLLGFFSFNGFAQEATIKIQEPITVEGHYSQVEDASNAASQGTVNSSMFEDIPLLRPGEIIETVPGMVVTQHSGDGKANQYFLRGYNLDHGTDFSTSVEGVSVNMPTNAHGQGYTDLNFLIPELVDHIDYKKGTYFAENGDFSAAGSADIHYRDSLEQSIADWSFGSFGYQRLLVAGSRALIAENDNNPFKTNLPTLLGALEFENYNGPWTTPENLGKSNIFLKFSDKTDNGGWSINASAYSAKWNSSDQVPLSLITSGQLNRYGSLDPTDGGNTGRDILSAEWHSKDADGYLKASAFLEHYQLQLWSDVTFYELRNGLAPNPSLPSDQFEQYENRNVFGTQLSL